LTINEAAMVKKDRKHRPASASRIPRPLLRRYPALPELDPASDRFPPAPPRDAVARLAAAGVRLRDDGRTLVATVPRELAASAAWPPLDRLLRAHAPWLADSAAVIEAVRRRFRRAEIVGTLRGLPPPLRALVEETVGGGERLEALLAGPLRGAELDLACLAFGEVRQVEWLLAQEGDDMAKRKNGVNGTNGGNGGNGGPAPARGRSTKRRGRPGPAPDPLRPERTQQRLAPAEVQDRLAAVPGWELTADARAIERTVRFPAYPLLVTALNLVTGLAELSATYPEIEVRDTRLTIRLPALPADTADSGGAGGLTARDLDFALALDGLSELGRGR
jgi:pterin-4a-carbinolamine dehydratase